MEPTSTTTTTRALVVAVVRMHKVCENSLTIATKCESNKSNNKINTKFTNKKTLKLLVRL